MVSYYILTYLLTYCCVKAAEQNKAKRYVMSAAMYQALVQAVKPP